MGKPVWLIFLFEEDTFSHNSVKKDAKKGAGLDAKSVPIN